MNTRLSLCLLAALTITGCQTEAQLVREAYPVPTPYVPAPPEVTRPEVDFDGIDFDKTAEEMTAAERGQLVQAIYIAAVQWKDYAEQLEAIYLQYKDASVETQKIKVILQAEIDRINSQAGNLLRQVELEKEKVALEKKLDEVKQSSKKEPSRASKSLQMLRTLRSD